MERVKATAPKSDRIRPARVPKKTRTLFAKLRSSRHGAGKNLTLRSRARQEMNSRRSGLRLKQWHGGKAFAGRRRHTIRAKSFRHKHPKQRGLTSKQMAQANYLKYGKMVF